VEHKRKHAGVFFIGKSSCDGGGPSRIGCRSVRFYNKNQLLQLYSNCIKICCTCNM